MPWPRAFNIANGPALIAGASAPAAPRDRPIGAGSELFC
jgi:hypothetical protein